MPETKPSPRTTPGDTFRGQVRIARETLHAFAEAGEKCMACDQPARRRIVQTTHTQYSGSLTITFLICGDHEAAWSDVYGGAR